MEKRANLQEQNGQKAEWTLDANEFADKRRGNKEARRRWFLAQVLAEERKRLKKPSSAFTQTV